MTGLIIKEGKSESGGGLSHTDDIRMFSLQGRFTSTQPFLFRVLCYFGEDRVYTTSRRAGHPKISGFNIVCERVNSLNSRALRHSLDMSNSLKNSQYVHAVVAQINQGLNVQSHPRAEDKKKTN